MRIWQILLSLVVAQVALSIARSAFKSPNRKLKILSSDLETSPSLNQKHYESGHEESGGLEHGSEHFSKSGSKKNKGHKKKHSWDKKEKGLHEKDEKLGHDEEEGGHKKSNYDDADSYKEYHEEAKKKKQGKHGNKKFHKNGSKTTGYHKKISKDEYHKEHKFYDEKHGDGEHKKFGSNYKHHNDEGEKHKKGDHHEANFETDHHKEKGGIEKGHHEEDHKGYKHKHGKQSHLLHHEEHEQKKGNEAGTKHGFSSQSNHGDHQHETDHSHNDNHGSHSAPTQQAQVLVTDNITEQNVNVPEISTEKQIKHSYRSRYRGSVNYLTQAMQSTSETPQISENLQLQTQVSVTTSDASISKTNEKV